MPVFDVFGKNITPESFRVCTLNVGNFSNGASNIPAGTDLMYNAFLDVFRKCNANIYMFSEWDVNYTSEKTSAETFGFLKPYKSTYVPASSSWQAQMIYSDYALSAEYHENYADLNTYFIDDTVKLSGKDVHLIATHFLARYQEQTEAQIEALLDYIESKNIEYYIVGGDMNLGGHGYDDRPQTEEVAFQIAREEINLLESNGGVSIQGGHWGCKDRDGFLNTAGHGGWNASHINMFDNFLISPNIRILNAFVATANNATDHDALCVDLIIK